MLPHDPYNRRFIVVLTPEEWHRCFAEGSGGDLVYNTEIALVEYPGTPKDELWMDLRRENLGTPGAVLVQSPYYPQNYRAIQEAAVAFPLEKHTVFSQLCACLGATECKVEQITKTARDGSSSIHLSAVNPSTSLKASVDKTTSDELASSVSLHDTFEGGLPDIDGAVTLLRATGLQTDQALASLVTQRRNIDNPIRSRTLSLDVSRETRKTLSVVGDLVVPQFLSRIENQIKTAFREQFDYSFQVSIRF